MSTKNQHVHDSSVEERRLRPIYDWLEMGNNKKARQECDKILKKSPQSSSVKALKALSLCRMGKEKEGMEILDNLNATTPTDEVTLQVMSLCYREFRQLEKVCELYETAVRTYPNNEELISHLFMAYVRCNDYKSQQRTAMALYKCKRKNPYYCWAVMSVVLQATRGEGRRDQKAKDMLLTLAERMMRKMIDQNQFDAEQEIQLYLLILDLQNKYDEILNVFDDEILKERLGCYDVIQNRLEYLCKLDRWADVNVYCKSVLNENPVGWLFWQRYIESTLRLHVLNGNNLENVDDTPEKCHEFICATMEGAGCDTLALRTPHLARLELCKQAEYLDKFVDTKVLLGDRIELFIEYFRKFGHRIWCVSDLVPYLNALLDKQMKSDLVGKLMKEVAIKPKSVPESKDQMQRHLCAVQIVRLCDAHCNLNDEHRMALITAFSLHYQHGRQAYDVDLLSTDVGCADTYALLAAHLLYDSAQTTQSSEPIIAALVLLEKLLTNSPSNYHAKLLAIRLYHEIGGVMGAKNIYNTLDLKHIQLDSLGYIHCARLPTTCAYSLCTSLYNATLQFFTTNSRDASEYLTYVYKYGSFMQVEKFMDSSERLNNSYHYIATTLDRIYLNIIELNTSDAIYNTNVLPKSDKIDFTTLLDNYDYKINENWVLDVELKPNFDDHIMHLRLRILIIRLLEYTVDVARQKNATTTNLRQVLEEWRHLWEKIGVKPADKHEYYLGYLPSRLDVALQCPYNDVLVTLFTLFCQIVEDDVRGAEKSAHTIDENLKELVNELDKRFNSENGYGDLHKKCENTEYLSNIIEILSVSTLVCVVCDDWSKGTTNHDTKRKKKVENGRGREHLQRTVNVIKLTLNNVCGLIEHRTVTCSVEGCSNGNVGDSRTMALIDALSLDGDVNGLEMRLRETLTDSYRNVTKEVRGVLKGKIKLLNGVAV